MKSPNPIFVADNSAHHNPNASANPQHLDLLPVRPGTLPLPQDPPPSPFPFSLTIDSALCGGSDKLQAAGHAGACAPFLTHHRQRAHLCHTQCSAQIDVFRTHPSLNTFVSLVSPGSTKLGPQGTRRDTSVRDTSVLQHNRRFNGTILVIRIILISICGPWVLYPVHYCSPTTVVIVILLLFVELPLLC